MREALAGQTSGDGPIGRRVEARLAALLGASRVLLTTSCTHALELALLALGIGPGQEVVCPSFTFVSSANAVLRVGARPVFADIEERHAGPRPRGRRAAAHAPHRRPPPRALRRRRSGHGGAPRHRPPPRPARGRGRRPGARRHWRGRALGTLGDAGCLSFHETKNVTLRRGRRARGGRPRARAPGRDRPREGHEPRRLPPRARSTSTPGWRRASSYVLSDVLAAILDAQLDKLDEIQARRAAVVAALPRGPRGLGGRARRAPARPSCRSAEPNHHIFYLLYPDGAAARRGARARCGRRGSWRRSTTCPCTRRPTAAQLGAGRSRLPVTDRVAATLLRLPLHPRLTDGRRRPGRRRGARDGVPRVSGGRPAPEPRARLLQRGRAPRGELRRDPRDARAGRAGRSRSIFVDDVSRDRTRDDPARRSWPRHPRPRPPRDPPRARTAAAAPPSPTASARRAGEIAGYLDVDLEVHCRYIPSLVRAIEKGADVATLRRIYAFQLRSLDRYFMSRGYSFLVRRLLGVPLPRHRDGLQVLPPRDRAPAPRRDRGPGLVLGHRVHGARRAARPADRRGPGGLHPPRGQDLDGPGPARLRSATSAQLLALPPRACGRGGREGARRDRLGAGARASASSRSPWSPTASPSSRSCGRPGCACSARGSAARTILHDVRFFNLYRRGLAGPRDRRRVLPRRRVPARPRGGHPLERQVTLAERVLVLTHMNVGYRDHPLQAALPGHGGAGGDRDGRLRGRERDRPARRPHRRRGRSWPPAAW